MDGEMDGEAVDPLPLAPGGSRPGYRYPTPTGEPCPRTVRLDGSVEHGGICQSCGTCLLFGGLFERSVLRSAD